MINLLGQGSPLNKFELINVELGRNSKTVHVELTGNDLTGDGSEGKPFKTAARAMEEATGCITQLVISLGAGKHELKNIDIAHVFLRFIGLGYLSVNSQGKNIVTVSRGAGVWFDVAVVDESTTPYDVAFLLAGGDVFILNDFSLSKAGALISNSYGNNTFFAKGCAISSVNTINKLHSSINSELVAFYNSATTYTNIT